MNTSRGTTLMSTINKISVEGGRREKEGGGGEEIDNKNKCCHMYSRI